MNLSKLEYDIIRNWIYRNARPIDLARWQYHFEKGKKETVLSLLSVYQNEDGGFGHALEPDSWNPDSAPIQTSTAIELLKEIDYYEGDHPVVAGILKYLDSCKNYKKGFWMSEIPSNNDYPHAPWWTYNEIDSEEWSYNPTAIFLGFILYFGNNETKIYQDTLISAEIMIEKVLNKKLESMHEISCLITFMEYVDKTNLTIKGLNAFKEKLKQAVAAAINPNTEEWADTYTCQPSNLFHTPSSIFYKDNKELADYQCQFLSDSRNSDGIWNICWNWAGNYEKEFAVSANWWKSDLVIKNMLYLRNFNSL